MTENNTTIERAYALVSLLQILSLATDGEQIAGKTFELSGGGKVLDMAAEMAFDILGELERAEMDGPKSATA
ncbi:hypothetical protein [Pseudorhodobacter sp.]|uniref:hypothetical protein n=1 Tax=Pseudorhodobacter sp. TaxID=1934400 RepID=UPI002AFE7469|nr:hypothetical protein [Pseudorhodobacter sp.]